MSSSAKKYEVIQSIEQEPLETDTEVELKFPKLQKSRRIGFSEQAIAARQKAAEEKKEDKATLPTKLNLNKK